MFVSVCSETLNESTSQYLLLLVGFDTLTYRKDYDRSPILVGHQTPPELEAGWWFGSSPVIMPSPILFCSTWNLLLNVVSDACWNGGAISAVFCWNSSTCVFSLCSTDPLHGTLVSSVIWCCSGSCSSRNGEACIVPPVSWTVILSCCSSDPLHGTVGSSVFVDGSGILLTATSWFSSPEVICASLGVWLELLVLEFLDFLFLYLLWFTSLTVRFFTSVCNPASKPWQAASIAALYLVVS